MEVKVIENEDFMQLLELCIEMYRAIDVGINDFQATNTLIHFINTTNGSFKAIGLYDSDVLMGFTMGYELNPKYFLFTGIYLKVKNSENTRKLIDFSLDFVKELGYTGWQVDATNPNIMSIMEKYDCRVAFTRYTKEFE